MEVARLIKETEQKGIIIPFKRELDLSFVNIVQAKADLINREKRARNYSLSWLNDAPFLAGHSTVNVTIPTCSVPVNDVIKVTRGRPQEWLANVSANVVRREGKLAFILKDTDRDLVFTPHYMQHQNRYGIYFRLE